LPVFQLSPTKTQLLERFREISTGKSAPVAEVKKNVSERIAKEPKPLTQAIVVVQLVNHKTWRFLQAVPEWDVHLQVSS
jgi:hypothetical protein